MPAWSQHPGSWRRAFEVWPARTGQLGRLDDWLDLVVRDADLS